MRCLDLLRRPALLLLGALSLPALAAAACSSGGSHGFGAGGSGAGNTGGSGTGGSGSSGLVFMEGGLSEAGLCGDHCSADHTAVLDCNNKTVIQCTAGNACDLSTGGCSPACTAAVNNKQSIGCEYYAPHPEMDYPEQCFAVFVANTWATPAHLDVEFYQGSPLTVASFARIPSGTGANITYAAYDPVGGLPSGEVAILFLAGDGSSGTNVPCPVPQTAVTQGSVIQGTGTRQAFHITSDVPVVAYQMSPFGGGAAFITGASLLLPTSVWDTNYVGVTAAGYDSKTMDNPSFNIVAAKDGTTVTLLPSQAIVGNPSNSPPLPAGPANMPYMFTLNAGQQAQFSQQADLSGTIVSATQPIGFLAANACMDAPIGTGDCDHGEQMLPPVKALGNEYAAVMFRPRVAGDKAIWHLVGVVDGTTLTYSSAVGGPAMLGAGQMVDFQTDQPFVVKSQDTMHPFMLFTYMTGALWSGLSDQSGYGDPDFVLSVPPQQYLQEYVFFADPSYPETNLVVVRAQDTTGMFQDVKLDCAGTLGGWQPVGDYEWTRIDLTTGDFMGANGCSSGAHTMSSDAPFGLWVWGWGTPLTTINTKYVSYGYPGGMNVSPLTGLVIPPMPK
jgi:IgGFc binding protein